MKTNITMKTTVAACLLALGTMFSGLACSTTVESQAPAAPSVSTHTSTEAHTTTDRRPGYGAVQTTRTTRSY